MTATKTFTVKEIPLDESTGFRLLFELTSTDGIYTHKHACYNREDGLKALKDMGFELHDDNPANT